MTFALSPAALAAALAPWSVQVVVSQWMPPDELLFIDGKMMGNALTIRRATRTIRNPSADARWADDWWHHGESRGWWES